jgi:predicted protein tyrosine phosphatase
MPKILTLSHHGLIRGIALANVLKLYFEPVDVLSVGYCQTSNSVETKEMLFSWADHIIVMQEKYTRYVPELFKPKVLVCEVGPDTYKDSHNPVLINKVWRWVRLYQDILGIKEHNRSL